MTRAKSISSFKCPVKMSLLMSSFGADVLFYIVVSKNYVKWFLKMCIIIVYFLNYIFKSNCLRFHQVVSQSGVGGHYPRSNPVAFKPCELGVNKVKIVT